MEALVPELVWQEWVRAMAEAQPIKFFQVLDEASVLSVLFPKIKQSPSALSRLGKAVLVTKSPLLRFAAMLSPLAADDINELSYRYRVPTVYQDLARLTAQEYPHYLNIDMKNAQSIFTFLKSTDALRRPTRFEHCLDVYSLFEERRNRKKLHQLLLNCLGVIKKVSTAPFLAQGLKGVAFAEALEAARIEAIKTIL